MVKHMLVSQNVNPEVTQSSLAHVSLPKMSHMDTFNFKLKESTVAWQDRRGVLVKKHTSSIEYKNVEIYGKINVSGIRDP